MNAGAPKPTSSTTSKKVKMIPENGTRRLWDYLTRLASAATLVIAGAIIAHEIRLSVIENTRFTAKDSVIMEKALRGQWETDMRDLKIQMKALEVTVRENLTLMNERFLKLIQEDRK